MIVIAQVDKCFFSFYMGMIGDSSPFISYSGRFLSSLSTIWQVEGCGTNKRYNNAQVRFWLRTINESIK